MKDLKINEEFTTSIEIEKDEHQFFLDVHASYKNLTNLHISLENDYLRKCKKGTLKEKQAKTRSYRYISEVFCEAQLKLLKIKMTANKLQAN